MSKDPMRVLAEPPAPLDAQGELQLDAELESLAQQLQQDSQRIMAAAPAGALDAELESLGGQLLADSRRVMAAAQPARAERRRLGWAKAVLRIAPVAAAAAIVCLLALPPLRPAPHPAPAAPQRQPVQETSHTADSIPWEQLSSPELEGALDLINGPVQISI